MNDEKTVPMMAGDVAKLMLIFDRRDSPTKDQIYEYGWGLGYSDVQINGMIEDLLNFGYIHEPIKDNFKMIRRFE